MDGNNQFLIPANTKKGQLIFGAFLPIDLAIFAIGLGLTFILLIVVSEFGAGTWASILAIIPGGIAGVLVVPFPNYHNVRVAIGEVINFYSNNRNYIWRGWCIKYESREK